MLPDQIQYYLQLAQQQAQQNAATAQTQATTQITSTVPQQATQIQLPGEISLIFLSKKKDPKGLTLITVGCIRALTLSYLNTWGQLFKTTEVVS